MRNLQVSKLGVAVLLLHLPSALHSQQISPNGAVPSNTEIAAFHDLYMHMEFDKGVNLSALKPGDVIEGKLSMDVYSQYRALFPAGSVVLLTVDKLEQRRRVPNDHWPWVIKVFTPRQEKYPTFQSAKVKLAAGQEIPLQVTFVSIGRDTELHADKSTHEHSKNIGTGDTDLVSLVRDGFRKIGGVPRRTPGRVAANFLASVESGGEFLKSFNKETAGADGQPITIAAGTQARVILLDSLSASKSREGDMFQARLVEPIFSQSVVVLPEGTIFEGRVAKRIPPRILSRSGSLQLSFVAMRTLQGAIEPFEAMVAGVTLDERSRMILDAEGGLRGDRPGLGWAVMNIAAAGGIAKLTDDGLQLLIELIVSSATDVSTAGTARIVAASVSGIFLLTRHGRDVVLPKYTEMQIVFDRQLILSIPESALAGRNSRDRIGLCQPLLP